VDQGDWKFLVLKQWVRVIGNF